MRGDGFDRETADRLLDGDAHVARPDGYGPVSDLLEDVRRLGAEVPDPAREAETIRAMGSAVGDVLGGNASRRRPRRLLPVSVRVAIVFGAVALVGAANAAAGGPLPDGGVAKAVLGTLGLSKEDEKDRVADELERQREQAKRSAEVAEQLAAEEATQTAPDPAQAGSEKAAQNRERALEFTTAKKAWTTCVAEKARSHEPGSGPFDPVAACGPKPKPTPKTDEDARSGDGEAGRRGPPPTAGPPAHAGPPPNAGPKEKTSTGKAAPPARAGAKTAKTPKGSVKPKVRKPKKSGKPNAAGPPDHADPPESAGATADAGPTSGSSEDGAPSGHGSRS